jgi:hypothetical protein
MKTETVLYQSTTCGSSIRDIARRYAQQSSVVPTVPSASQRRRQISVEALELRGAESGEIQRFHLPVPPC